ncbi:hypothetical protein OHA21_44355 [Actinoplanes sp. NBC_00393]|uniref:hypothetical protein n=1 Tax=Actinoplanes sp. NBC_00393 TaxID=2975953 RepID=UPI002E24CE24
MNEQERQWWPLLRERLRVPGHLMAFMRGVLGDVEIVAVTAVTPHGAVTPVAVLATPDEIAQEIHLIDDVRQGEHQPADVRHAEIGGYDAPVLTIQEPDGQVRPIAVFITPWIEQHLLLFARTLWRRY